jgi:hypothetical protein
MTAQNHRTTPLYELKPRAEPILPVARDTPQMATPTARSCKRDLAAGLSSHPHRTIARLLDECV